MSSESTSSGSLVHALRQNWPGKTDIAVQTILLAVAFVVVGLRLWTRRRLRVSLQGNDWFILAATVIMLGRYIVELLLILLCGMGIHTDEVVRLGGSETLVRFNKLTYVGELLWVTVVALIQLSILQYYFRRFQEPIIMRLTCVLIGLCSALWIASLLANAFLCTPPRKVWLASVEGDCGDRKMLHTGCAVSELILNIFILLLPIPILRHMRFSRKGGISLASTYLLGLVIIALSALRVDTKLFLTSKDSTYGSAPESLVSSIVTLLGIIVACLPVLAPASQRINGTPECTLISETPRSDTVSGSRYWKATVLSGGQKEEPEIPLVTVSQPPVGKMPGFNEWALGQIKITSDWEIHSTRNSARLDKDSIRRG